MESEEEISIDPLLLPIGVSTEVLAKLVFNILYRRALAETDLWAHWVLLATVQILETNTAPPLDISSLCKLRGLSQENYIAKSKCQDCKNNIDKQNHEAVSIERHSMKEKTSAVENKNEQVHSGSIENEIKKRHISGQEIINKKRYRSGSQDNTKKRHKSGSVDKKCHSSGSKNESSKDITLISNTERNEYIEQEKKDSSKKRKPSGTSNKVATPRKGEYKNVDIKKEYTSVAIQVMINEKKPNSHLAGKSPSADADARIPILKRNNCCQVSPRTLRLVKNKWTQMWIKKSVSQICQTESPYCENQNITSEPDSTASICNLPILELKETIDKEIQASIHCSDRESQTIVVCYRHASSQATPWKLTPVSGLPKRSKRDSCSVSNEINLMKSTETGKNVCEEMSFVFSKTGKGGEKVQMERGECKSNVMKKMEIFHGRLLITSRSKIEAPVIPGSPIESSLLLDPRCAEECHIRYLENM